MAAGGVPAVQLPPALPNSSNDGSRRAHLPLVGPGRVYPCDAPPRKTKGGGGVGTTGSAAGAGGMSGSAGHPHAPPWPPHRGAGFQFIRCRFCVAPVRFAEEMPLATRTTPAARPYSQLRERRAGASGKSLEAQGSTLFAPRAGLCGRLAVGQTYQ